MLHALHYIYVQQYICVQRYLVRESNAMNDKKEYLLNQLSGWLREQGLQPQMMPSGYDPLRPDMMVDCESGQVVVEVKVAHAYRSKVFPALVGDAILRARYANPQAALLLAFLLNKINSKAVEDIERYADQFCPDLSWFLLDESGSGIVSLHGVRSEIAVESYVGGRSPVSAPSPVRGGLFSPSNRRLLRMLLLPGIDARYWGGPYERPDGVGNLAQACGVSQPKASAFLKLFEGTGYVRREKGALMVIRHEELLDEWFFALKQERHCLAPVRSMYGDSADKVVERLRTRHSAKDKPDIVVGHHLGCHLHGLGRSSAKSAMLYIGEHVDSVMRQLDLVGDASDSPGLWLVQRDYEAVRQGAVMVDGIQVCDILQCYLDVRGSKARGREQADYIAENILLPHFRRSQ